VVDALAQSSRTAQASKSTGCSSSIGGSARSAPEVEMSRFLVERRVRQHRPCSPHWRSRSMAAQRRARARLLFGFVRNQETAGRRR
jgi:hypothetical protein